MWFCLSSRRRHTRYWRDWSSDVCSSDLADQPHPTLKRTLLVRSGASTARQMSQPGADGGAQAPDVGGIDLRPYRTLGEIGRVSCRVRAEIRVVAESLKSKWSTTRTNSHS